MSAGKGGVILLDCFCCGFSVASGKTTPFKNSNLALRRENRQETTVTEREKIVAWLRGGKMVPASIYSWGDRLFYAWWGLRNPSVSMAATRRRLKTLKVMDGGVWRTVGVFAGPLNAPRGSGSSWSECRMDAQGCVKCEAAGYGCRAGAGGVVLITDAERVEKMRQVVHIYLPPDSGITAEECLSKLIELLDGPGVFIVEDGGD